MKTEWAQYNFKKVIISEEEEAEDTPEKREIVEYNFLDLQGRKWKKDEQKEKEINDAREGEFKISPVVSRYRGLKDYREKRREKRIEEEVEKRANKREKLSHREGFARGFEEGREESLKKMEEALKGKIEAFGLMVGEISKAKEEILINQKKDIYNLIKSLTKWIILRELKDDGHYIQRLLDRVLLEFQNKDNILLKVNLKDFENMPEVLDLVQQNMGKLKNVRVEIDHSSHLPGLVVESEKGIVDGTLKQQFNKLNKLFESVGLSS